jgi:hypothetical protein
VLITRLATTGASTEDVYVIIPVCVFMVLLAFIVSITATARTNGKVGLAYPGPTTPMILQQSASAPLHAVCFARARMQQCTTKESTALLPIITLVIGGAKFAEASRHGVVHLQHAATAAAVEMGLPFLGDGLPPATLHSLHYYHRSTPRSSVTLMARYQPWH